METQLLNSAGMYTHTLALADKQDLMLTVRLSRNAMAVEYSLSTQQGIAVVGPCRSENELESLCYRLSSIARIKAEQEQVTGLRLVGRYDSMSHRMMAV
jgi:hypothetical protein